MFSQTRMALCIAIGAMALAAGEANAGCKFIGGSYVCAAWIVGSEVCQVTVDGQALVGGPVSTGDISVKCEVLGVDTTDGICATGDLPKGTVICVDDNPYIPPPPKGHGGDSVTRASGLGNENPGNGRKVGQYGHDCKHVDANGHMDPACFADVSHDVPGSGTLPPAEFEPKCNGNGICTGTGEVQLTGYECPAGTHFVDFTADQFLAHVTACENDTENCVDLWQVCTKAGDKYDCVDLGDTFPGFCIY